MLPRRSTLSGSDYERQTSDRDLRGTISAAGATPRDAATSRRPPRSAWSALAARADRPQCPFHLRTQVSHKLALAQLALALLYSYCMSARAWMRGRPDGGR